MKWRKEDILVSSVGLADAFCKSTGHFVNGDKSRLHS